MNTFRKPNLKRRIDWLKRRWRWVAGLLGIGVILYGFALPRVLFDTPKSIVLEDTDGVLLGALIAADGQWRFPATDSIPSRFARSLVVFEDKRFYRHWGVDLRALGRAVLQNLRNGRVVSGGSTLSMQVIRLAKGNPPRTVWNKLIEIILATRLEIRYSKEEILQLYAANAPFGGNVVGLEAASWRYFGKDPGLLSWSEAALLAVLPNSPALIHPGRNREALRAKRNRLLQRLHSEGLLDSLSTSLAMEENLPEQPLPLPQLAPHLLQRIAREVRQGKRPTPRFRSSIRVGLQRQLNTLVQSHHEVLKHNNIFNAAAIIVHVPTRSVIAYTGNVPNMDQEHGSMVDLIPSARSTGSILKPFLYNLALDDGLLLPNSFLSDAPVNYGSYRPVNFNEDYSGIIPAEEALSRSLNVPFVNLLQSYGLERFHFQLQKMGLHTLTQPPSHYGLTLVLGGAEATLEDLTRMYTNMALSVLHFQEQQGFYHPPDFGPLRYTPQQEIPARERELVREPPLYSAAAAWWTLQAMQRVKRPNSEGDWEAFRSGRRIAWKTGTSYGFRDAWAIGVSPDYVVGVWAGNADGEGRPGLVGVSAAGPLLFDIFSSLPATEWFPTPYDELEQLPVCSISGFAAGEHCPVDSVWAPRVERKTEACPYHQLLHLDPGGTHQVSSNCVSPLDMVHRTYLVLPPLEAFYYKTKNPLYLDPPPFKEGCAPNTASAAMQLIYPQSPTRIYVPLDLNGELSRTVFQLAHRRDKARVHWHLDETYLGSTYEFHSFELKPEEGPHLLTLVDDEGNTLRQAFEIIKREE